MPLFNDHSFAFMFCVVVLPFYTSRHVYQQQLKLKEEEKAAEIAQLQKQVRQLVTEKEHQQQSKEREVAELRRQLETSQRTSAKKGRASLFGFFSKTRSGDDGSQEKHSTHRIEKQQVRRVSKCNNAYVLI